MRPHEQQATGQPAIPLAATVMLGLQGAPEQGLHPGRRIGPHPALGYLLRTPVEHARKAAQGIGQRPAEPQHLRPRPQFLPGDQVTQEFIEQQPLVDEIAQAVTKLALVEHMGGGMQQQIGPGQKIQVVETGQGARFCKHPVGIRLQPRGLGQDAMVHVQHGAPLDVLHGGQLMHPAPVVTLVVGIAVRLRRHPAFHRQAPLDVSDGGLGHHDVDIGKTAAAGTFQSPCHIGRPLEQHHGATERRQGLGQQADLPTHVPGLGLRLHAGRLEVPAGLGRNAVRRAPFFEQQAQPGQQACMAGLANEQIPVRQTQPDGLRRVAEDVGQETVAQVGGRRSMARAGQGFERGKGLFQIAVC